VHVDAPAQCPRHPFEGWIAARLGREDLGNVVGKPEPPDRGGIAAQDHDRPARNAPHLAQPAVHVGPLVDREGAHARVERLVREGEGFRHAVDGRGQVGRALRAHGGGRLQRGDLPLGRFVGTSAHIQHRVRIAQPGIDRGQDAAVGAPVIRVAPPEPGIVDVACAAIGCSGHRHSPWG
jgi:hypothetical protein